jgi:hypothetical protein
VLDRFELPEVLQYNVLKPYRPEALREHAQVKHYYEEGRPPPENDGPRLPMAQRHPDKEVEGIR